MKYIYPVIFTKEDGQYLVSVPDLSGCYTFGSDLQEAVDMARDAMAMWLCIAEDKKEEIPEANLDILKNGSENEIITLIDVDTIEYRKITNPKSVKKTLTIPQWLNDMAVRENINFSNVLQNALLEQLHVSK